MKSVAQFKVENGIDTIQFYKGKKQDGCQWADTPVGRLFLPHVTNTAKPCFIIVNDGKGNPKKGIAPRPELTGTMWVVNAEVTLGSTM